MHGSTWCEVGRSMIDLLIVCMRGWQDMMPVLTPASRANMTIWNARSCLRSAWTLRSLLDGVSGRASMRAFLLGGEVVRHLVSVPCLELMPPLMHGSLSSTVCLSAAHTTSGIDCELYGKEMLWLVCCLFRYFELHRL